MAGSIACFAVVGQQNNPLYLRTWQSSGEQHLQLHYIVHCALDAVDEKALQKRSPADPTDLYLGLLYPTEQYRVYGYVSNSHIKFLLVVEDFMPKDEAVIRVFKRLHAAYVDTTSNPFYTFGAPLKSPAFESAVDSMAGAFPRGLASAGSLTSSNSYA